MNIKNAKGFTLVEVMTALGIMSILVMVIMRAQQSAMTSTGDLRVTSEVNNLYQTLTTELSRVETCNANFQNKPNGYVPTFITNKSGVKVIQNNTAYGQEIDITTMAVTVAGNVWNLRVNYIPHLKDPITKVTVAPRFFVIPITVYLDGAGSVKSCFSDVQSLIEKAIQNSCDTTNSVYTPGVGAVLGTCNSDFVVKSSAAATVPLVGSTYLCPAGEFLQKVTINGASPNITFQ